MKITDKVALSILSCLLGLFLIVGSVCGILSVTVCNSDFMLKVFNSRVDYSSIQAEYCEEQEYLAIPAGVGEGVLSSVVQQPEFESIINLMVEKAYADDGVSLVTEFDSLCLTERFYQAMYQYFSVEKGYDITEEMSNDMYYVAGIANDNCFALVKVLPDNLLDQFGNLATELSRYFKIAVIVSLAVVIALITLLSITKKWRSHCVLCIGMALLMDGIMLIPIPFYVLMSGKYKYLNIEVEAFYNTAVGLIEKTMVFFLVVGIVLIIAALVIAFFFFFLPIIREKRNTKTEA